DVLVARGEDEQLEIGLDVFVAPVKKPMVKYAVAIQNELVRADISSVVDVMDRPLKKLLEQADSMKAKYVIIVGQRDLEKGEVSLRNMSTKETAQVKMDEVAATLSRLVKRG
ncbi:MAG: His/Gly/Thr/Pro-type tRNA ligase C-terminal domain-containing protein, partial [Candidatus Hermodarchaeota archaeon]